MPRLLLSFGLLAAVYALGVPSFPASQASGQKPDKAEAKIAPSLEREIRHRLLVLPYYSVFDSISFTLDGSKVTLTGQVLRPTLKADAEAALKTIEGVDTVLNQIEVLPPSTADDEIRCNVYRAIFEERTLEVYAIQAVPPIHILVKNGDVSLEGSVNTTADKNLAAARAKAVANVLSLKNNLVVQP